MKSLSELEKLNNDMPINESALYDELIEKLVEAKNNNVPINEGILTGLLGGALGATVGPTIMKTICKVLGIDEKGTLGNLMTSRLVLTAVGAKVGW